MEFFSEFKTFPIIQCYC